jgi:O-methyltransferase
VLVPPCQTVAFLDNPAFKRAYRRGMFSGHFIERPERRSDDDPESDLHIEWRVAVCCWAARHAALLEGDFAECGVNTGILSLAACDYVDFNATGKTFWLFDTYRGIPEHTASAAELPKVRIGNGAYRDCFEVARRNFAPFPRARLVRGEVPASFAGLDIGPIAYLSLDMNVAASERAAIEFFWPRLVRGGVVVLDDYGFVGYEPQRITMDEFARSQGVEVWTLPTGRGLLLKP